MENFDSFLRRIGFANYIADFRGCLEPPHHLVAQIKDIEALKWVCGRPETLAKIVELRGHRDSLIKKLAEYDDKTLPSQQTADLPFSPNFVLNTEPTTERSSDIVGFIESNIDIIIGETNSQPSDELLDETQFSASPEPPPSKKKKLSSSTGSKSDAADPTTPLRSEKSTDLLDLLEKSAEGKYVKALHAGIGFDNKARLRLVALVLNAEYGADTNTLITSSRFQDLAASICEAFPGEDEDTYYVPAFTPARGKTIIAKGKLYDRYTSLNKDLRETGLRVIRPGRANAETELPRLVHEGEAADIEGSLNFLRSNLRPWSLVVEHWKKTAAHRLNSLLTGSNPKENVSSYFELYACLKQKEGYELLEQDFDVRFPDSSLTIYSHWQPFSNKVKAELTKKGISTDGDADLLRKFVQLFSVIPVKVKKGKAWRADRPSILQGFLHLIPKTRDFTKELDDILIYLKT